MNCSSSFQAARLSQFLVFSSCWVFIMLHILHLAFMYFFLPIRVSVVEILVMMSMCLSLGSYLYGHGVVLLNKCFVAGMLV